MGKKLTYTFVKKAFEAEGYILLENKYIGNRQKLNIRSLNGKEYYTTWMSWEQGKRPWRDLKKFKITIEEVRKSFEEKGYKLLSKEYINNNTKLDFICDRGHKHSIILASWKNGHICKFCSLEDRRNKPKYKVCDSNGSTKLNGIVYRVSNKINNKMYIGQTIYSLHKRKIKHLSLANKKSPTNHFHRALKKYDKDNFIWDIIGYCTSKKELDAMEFHYIKYYDTYKNGYNMTLGGEGTIGRVCKESTKRKISKSKTGIKMSEEFKKKLSVMRRGVKKSKKHIENVVASKSKYWEITYPDGHVEVIKNLSAFCRENDLSDRGMWMVAHYRRNHHKGFKCKKVDSLDVMNG